MSLPQHQADVEHNGTGTHRGMFGVHIPHVQVPKKPEKPRMSLRVKNRESQRPFRALLARSPAGCPSPLPPPHLTSPLLPFRFEPDDERSCFPALICYTLNMSSSSVLTSRRGRRHDWRVRRDGPVPHVRIRSHKVSPWESQRLLEARSPNLAVLLENADRFQRRSRSTDGYHVQHYHW
jgi:hypothetical protein